MNFQFAQQGGSFAGAMAYYCHDKREPGAARPPDSAERVAWSETRNMLTDRTEIATQIMIATAERAPVLKERAGIAATGRKATKPVAAFSLAWHPSEAAGLERAEMVRVADQALKVMGLDHCQSVIIAHRDTRHPHVHVVVNRVNPETGRMEKIDPNKVRSLDRWAHEYETERGQIYSPDRAAKYDRMEARRARHPEKADRVRYVEERRETPDRPERRERRARPEGPRPERRERPEGRETPARLERPGRKERPESREPPDRPESREPPDRLEGRDRPERRERPERGAEGSPVGEGGVGPRDRDKGVQGAAEAPRGRLNRAAEVSEPREGRSETREGGVEGREARGAPTGGREDVAPKRSLADAVRQRLERVLGRSQGREAGSPRLEADRVQSPAKARPERPERAERPADGSQGREDGRGPQKGPETPQPPAQSPAQALRARSDALKDRHKAEWTELGRAFARAKAETYDRWRGPIKDVPLQLKADARPLWREHFAEERQAARDRARLERSFGGRLGLSIAAARDQRDQRVDRVERDQQAPRGPESAGPERDHRDQRVERGFVRLVLANFLSRDLREATFAQVTQRDRAVFAAQVREVGDERRAAVTAERAAELGQLRETYGRDRTALTERQGVERAEVRAAWREIYREKGRDWVPRGAEDRGAEAQERATEDRPRGGQARGEAAEERARTERAGGERDRAVRPAEQGRDEGQGRDGGQAQERGGDRPRDVGPEPLQPTPAPSKFAWLDQRQQGVNRASTFARSQEAQERAKEQGRDKDQARDKDRGDRER